MSDPSDDFEIHSRLGAPVPPKLFVCFVYFVVTISPFSSVASLA
jgi:hypothetical protein